jgi:hypothetical protein
MPPKPSNFPTQVQLRYNVIDLPFGGPAPTVSTNIQGNNALVVYPLSSIPASADNKFGATVAAKWINPFFPTPTQGFRTLNETFDSIKINEDHDYFSAEWDNLWVGVNGKWIELSGPLGRYGLHDADNGDLFTFPAGGKSVTVTVPETGELKIKTSRVSRRPRKQPLGQPPQVVSSLLSRGSVAGKIQQSGDRRRVASNPSPGRQQAPPSHRRSNSW